MRLALTVLAHNGLVRDDVLVDVEATTTIAELAAALNTRAPAETGPKLATVLTHPRLSAVADRSTLWAYGHRLDPDLTVGAVLHDGALVARDESSRPSTRLVEPDGLAELRVCGGPHAGNVVKLGLGRSTLGSGLSCGARLVDESVPAHAATITVAPDGEVSINPAEGVTITLDQQTVGEPTAWAPGGVVRVGESVLFLAVAEAPDAHLAPTGDGGLAYNRPPRLRPPPRGGRLTIPQKPEKGDGVRFQLLSAVLPLLLGGVLWYVTKNALSLLFCLMSPVLMVGSYVSDTRFGRKKHRTALKKYKELLATYETDLEELRQRDEIERRDSLPDPASALLIAVGPRRRLWERRLDDPDTLQLRTGLTDLPATVHLELGAGASRDAHVPQPPTVHSVPVAIPFASLGVVGVAGPREQSLRLATWLVAQTALLHSPRDLSLVVLSLAEDADAAWNWVRWLPHAKPRDGQDCAALTGADPETIARRVAELVGEIDRRREASSAVGTVTSTIEKNIVVVLDGARALRRVPGMPQVLRDGPRHGVFAICVDEDERLLPEECATVAHWLAASVPGQPPTRIRFRGGGLELLGEVLADQVGAAWCQVLARALAPIRDVSRDEAGSALPDSARLLSLLGLPDPAASQVLEVWRRNGRTTEVPVGVGSDGTFYIDLRNDGPHALVAGTTGAGKSELLQSLIASLAVANRPDALNFVLIDYKGGSAFQDCARLPHTVGMVSDLDAHLTKRALASLAAELKRREEILFDAGAKDIEDYWDTSRTPMARLVLVIDEFASLVEELPDFVTGLVDIARRGRSLGVHLVLATQRPAGVVSADIRANTNLRIALRVTSVDDSQDVIDARDAASIAKSTPGRAYVRSGASSLALMQAARIGGRRSSGESRRDPDVAHVSWSQLGRPPVVRAQAASEDMTTDLSVLVDAVGAAAREAGIAVQQSPWLPPLAATVTVADLPASAARVEPRGPVADPHAAFAGLRAPGPAVADVHATFADPAVANLRAPRPAVADAHATFAGTHAADPALANRAGAEVEPVPYGLCDIPAEQRRAALVFDLVHGGNILIAGSPRSGRSTALRTLAGSLAQRVSPADAHLYAVDCGANALLPLVGLPHCGAVISRDQVDRVDRLFDRLLSEVSRRQQLLAAQGASSLAEQRAMAAPDDRLPWMVLLLDRWEGFTAAFETHDMGRLVDTAMRLFREGPAVGLRTVMTSDRSGLVGQVSSVFDDKVILRLTDPNDFGMAGISAKEVPATMAPGRALCPTGAGVLEAQIALLDPDTSGPAQVAALQAIGRSTKTPDRRRRPMRVDVLPVRATAAEARSLDPAFTAPSPTWALIGVGGDELAAVGVDLAVIGPGFVVAGPPRSGRSTALVTMARSLAGNGMPLVLVTPRRSPLRTLAAAENVLAVLDDTAIPETLRTLLDGHKQYTVLVDDAELLYDTLMDEALAAVIREGRDGDCALVAAGTADALATQYRGFVADARRSRSGMIIAPQGPTEGELFGVRLPRNVGGGPLGRGILVTSGELALVQVVLPE